jgi:hypothetical protein
VTGLRKTIALAEPILERDLASARAALPPSETDDPDALGEMLRAVAVLPSSPRPASFTPAAVSAT